MSTNDDSVNAIHNSSRIALLDAYEDNEKGKESFIALSYEDAEYIRQRTPAILCGTLNGAVYFVCELALSVSAFLLTYLPPSTKILGISSPLIVSGEIALSHALFGVGLYVTYGVYSDMRNAAKRMLEKGQRPIERVGFLLPQIKDLEKYKAAPKYVVLNPQL